MNYGIDLKNISLSEYKLLLKKQNLMAGRRVLKENIDERFDRLAAEGHDNVGRLYVQLTDEQGMERLAGETGIPVEYLAILQREISGIFQKPVLIADFPYISPPTFKKLGEYCVQTSKDFYDLSEGCTNAMIVSEKTGIPENDAKELCSLCDLIRINGVGPVFSRVLFEAGYFGADEIASADAEEIFYKTSEMNKLNAYTRAIPDIYEIQLCIDFAKLLVRNINFAVS